MTRRPPAPYLRPHRYSLVRFLPAQARALDVHFQWAFFYASPFFLRLKVLRACVYLLLFGVYPVEVDGKLFANRRPLKVFTQKMSSSLHDNTRLTNFILWSLSLRSCVLTSSGRVQRIILAVRLPVKDG
jgi:hypothetical protein